MENNLIYYDMHSEVPQNAQKAIKGGRLKGFTDINPMWRIKALTEMFGPVGIGWYYKIVNKTIERENNEAAAFVDIELYYKHEGEWSMPVCGTGGSSFVENESKGLYMSDECFKMALTDAISVACKAIGIGGKIYWDATDSKYQKDVTEINTKEMAIEEVKKLKIMFGKHKGMTLEELVEEEGSYCDWLIKSEKTDQWIKDGIAKIRKQPKGEPESTVIDYNEIIKIGYKKGYNAAAIEKACIKDFNHGMEHITKAEYDIILQKLKGLKDK